jgi:preprotein translocase subunit SecY
MLEAIVKAWAIPELRKRVQYVFLMFATFAIGAHIPVPGLDHDKIMKIFGGQAGGLLGLVDVFSGGALRRMSIFAMGIGPYINASIIMQMMTFAVPALEAMQKEGEAGRKRIAAITRKLTILFAAIQALSMVILFRNGGAGLNIFQTIQIVVVLTAGSTLLLWLGEQVTQKGVGNGISLVIFAGITLSLPYQVNIIRQQLVERNVTPLHVLLFLGIFIGTVYAVVYITQGSRRIPIAHAKRVIGMRQTQASASFLPIKVNSAGVIPIIFAISLMLFPATILNLIPVQPGQGPIGWLKERAMLFNPGQLWSIGPLELPIPTLFYALLVVAFTYFYTSIVMNVGEMSDNLKKYGNYIPGIRPGKPTHEYLDRVISRITFAGAVFLAGIAILQYLVYWLIPGMSKFQSFQLIGGTSLLIVVGVAIETMQAIEAQLLMRDYEGFIKPNAKSGR